MITASRPSVPHSQLSPLSRKKEGQKGRKEEGKCTPPPPHLLTQRWVMQAVTQLYWSDEDDEDYATGQREWRLDVRQTDWWLLLQNGQRQHNRLYPRKTKNSEDKSEDKRKYSTYLRYENCPKQNHLKLGVKGLFFHIYVVRFNFFSMKTLAGFSLIKADLRIHMPLCVCVGICFLESDVASTSTSLKNSDWITFRPYPT